MILTDPTPAKCRDEGFTAETRTRRAREEDAGASAFGAVGTREKVRPVKPRLPQVSKPVEAFESNQPPAPSCSPWPSRAVTINPPPLCVSAVNASGVAERPQSYCTTPCVNRRKTSSSFTGCGARLCRCTPAEIRRCRRKVASGCWSLSVTSNCPSTSSTR